MQDVYLLGRLGSDIQVKTTSKGGQMGTLIVATSKKRGDKEFTYWHRVLIFNKTVEMMAPILKRGAEVFIKGEACPSQYKDAQGVTKYSNDIIAQYVRVSKDARAKEGTYQSQPHISPGPDNFSDSFEGDVPF